MKKINYIFCSVILLLAACNKEKVITPTFDVSVDRNTYRTGDTVAFKFRGSAGYIQFYSGEKGKNYDSIGVFNSAVSGSPAFSFTSNVQGGTATLNNLTVLVSNDFSGTYDANSVTKATWNDVTARGKLATSATNLASGTINVNDLKVEGKPLYVAFHYTSPQNTLAQRQWTISAFTFSTTYTNSTVYNNAIDVASGGFGSIELAGDSTKWTASTSLVHLGLAAGYPADDDWAISKPMDINALLSSASNVVNIKAFTDPMLSSYNYVFTKPGIYRVVFTAENANYEKSDKVVKRITISITP